MFHRNLSFKTFSVSHAVRHSLSTASGSGQCWACCWFSGSCTMEMTSSGALWAWGSHAPGGLGTTLASVREQILPNLASNGQGNQTGLHCFILVLRNKNFYQLSSSLLPQFPRHSQSYFSCKMNGNMLFFNKLCLTLTNWPWLWKWWSWFLLFGGWFGKHLRPSGALSGWKNLIQWDCSYVRLFYMWDHWFISVCGLEVFCNHTSYWGFTVKTPRTEKGYVYWYSIDINLIFF